MEYKNKAARSECYAARDKYYDCIGDQKAVGIDKNICKQLYLEFEKLCGKKWTDHFLKRHDYEVFKKKLNAEGVEKVDKTKLDL